MRLMSDVFYLDWRYLVGAGRREERRVAREASREVRAVARRLASDERIAALSLGNEIPADVLRWTGAGRVAGVLARLVDAVHDEDCDRLVTYANYPTAEYLPLSGLDFLTFNVFLEHREDLRRYLTHLHHLAGDRPLVLGEVGHEAGGDEHEELSQAAQLDGQLATMVERGLAGFCVFSWTDEWWVGDAAVTDWHFGLTREDRSPRPALAVAERWNRRSVSDLDYDWPSISVVVCAYNAAATLEECLRHACALDYPRLEILVVDDGSTDETAAIAAAHERVRLLSLPHGGLSVARNEGFRAAGAVLVAYLDSDAYPTPEWPYFLALGLDGPRVAGVGGPNVPPRDDPRGAQKVARAPGGPVHVLLADDRAEHVPGCNMAFWRELLDDVGGFDPIYTAAGDDVDVCWKVLDCGWEIGFHPAALVWHHARGGLRTYLRQQRGYGGAEALVEARHPHRFNASGAARWHGRIYDGFAPRMLRQRVYRGMFGASAYQSVYRRRSDGGRMRQVGVPVAAACLPSSALAAASPSLAVPAGLALALLVGLFVREAAIVSPPCCPCCSRYGARGAARAHARRPARDWSWAVRCLSSFPRHARA
jgi:glycosyltransferase involved in cell wall biosynthesis